MQKKLYFCAKIQRKMKKIVLFLALIASSTLFAGQNAKYLQYIEDWKNKALEQQALYDIPACITLAQGLLESAAGQSELATKANNHFGIKCSSDWLGGSYYYDDDHKGECFRVYQNAEESFVDHSLFLKRDRYKTLYELDPVDYRRWAQGLKDCGYATDPSYASKLISIIEEYALDTLVGSDFVLQDRFAARPADTATPEGSLAELAVGATSVEAANEVGEIWVEAKTAKEEKWAFKASHRQERVNHTPFVYAREGDSYASIAYQLNIKERTLREWNDAVGHTLQVNDRVFLSKKPKYVRGEKEIMWVHPGESLWMICQREGIQLKTIYEVNGIPQDVKVFETRQKIMLGKPKK